MLSDDGQVALTFNGEIYNYRELRAGLEARGIVFAGHSDTEVLLRLYLESGLSALSQLNGIFAFAIHDKRREELILVRDALGVKPSYYSAGGDGFAFASVIKTLLPLLVPGPSLDLASLHPSQPVLWCPGAGTPPPA